MAKLIHDTLKIKLKEYAAKPNAKYPLSPDLKLFGYDFGKQVVHGLSILRLILITYV